jgi:hypothetical protein
MIARERANRRRRERFPSPDRRGFNVLVSSECPACGKRCYKTRGDAKRAGRQIGGQTRPYLCPRGEFWHLTSAGAEETVRWRGGGDDGA